MTCGAGVLSGLTESMPADSETYPSSDRVAHYWPRGEFGIPSGPALCGYEYDGRRVDWQRNGICGKCKVIYEHNA
jgi:hypothetical protein